MRKTRMSIALLAGAVTCAIVASVALAATITGTRRCEHLVGTNQALYYRIASSEPASRAIRTSATNQMRARPRKRSKTGRIRTMSR